MVNNEIHRLFEGWAVLRGGNANNGVNTGFVYVTSAIAASPTSAFFGAQLGFFFVLKDPASWQKISFNKRVLVAKAKVPAKQST